MSELVSSENPTVNDDYDSESTIIHLDNKDDTSLDVAFDSLTSDEANVSESPTFRSFSPLPSTSSDNITIDLNNTRFNKAGGHYRPSLNLPSDLSFTNEDDEIVSSADKSTDEYTTKSLNDFTNIIECSSSSETDDNLKTVVNGDVKNENDSKSRKRKRDILKADPKVDVKNENNSKSQRRKKLSNEVIDLLLDDIDEKIYDSDCEIVDVDLLIAQNNAVLNSQIQVIELNETTDAEVVSDTMSSQDASQSASVAIPPEERPITTFEKMKMIVRDFFDKRSRFLKEQASEVNNSKSSAESVANVVSSINKTPLVVENRKKRERKRGRPTKVKRHKVIETIDLSGNSYPNPRMVNFRGSEIIDIDSDSSMIIENSLNRSNSNLEVKSSPVVDFQNITIPDSSVRASIQSPIKNYGECPVCLESFTQGNAVSTFCGHIFCATCMNKIKLTSKKCPKCRKSLGRGKGFHPIFL